MIHILFIVPYPELREKVEYVLDNHPENKRISANIQVLTVDQISRINAGSYDAVIARGFSAKQLKAMHPQTPVIDLAISGYDIIRTVAECRKDFNSTQIAICGFYGKIYEASDICKLLGCEVEIYPASNHKDLEASIDEAVAHGCDALIGGYSAVELAEKHGIPSRLIRTGEDTILQAINEAIRTVEQIQIERIVAETYKTIIYASKDGILYIDSTGTIRVRNRVVKAMNNNISLLSRSLRTTLPYLYKSFSEVLKGGQEINGSILTIPKSNLTVSASFVPVVVNNNISGVVITLSDITEIQKLENQIRRSLSEKGLRAKYTFDDIIHKSAVIDATIDTARRYAASDSNVIIVGETGTGKELFAQSIHNASPRKMDPLSPSTVPLCRKICWKASSLAMWRAPLPAVSKAVKWDFLNRRTAEPCFWMKLVKFPFPPRPSCCGFSRNARSEELVITRSSPSMSALFPPPTKASISLPAKNCSAVI